MENEFLRHLLKLYYAAGGSADVYQPGNIFELAGVQDEVDRAIKNGHLRQHSPNSYELTEAGFRRAKEVEVTD